MEHNFGPNIASRSSSSSSRSVHSTHSNSTLKANSPPNAHNRSTPTTVPETTIFPYAVGKLSDYQSLGSGGPSFQQHVDTTMDDPFAVVSSHSHSQDQHSHPHPHPHPHPHAHHQRHRIDSQGVPIPPARTTSLGHQASSSTTSLPSVQVTTATPTKNRIRADTTSSTSYTPTPAYSSPYGSGSLQVGVSGDSFDLATSQRDGAGAGTGGIAFPASSLASSSTDHLTSYTSIEEDSDPEVQAEKRAQELEAEFKKERIREQTKVRQRRKRANDKAKKEAARTGQIPITPTAVSRSGSMSQRRMSRNTSATSLAPLIVPSITTVSPGLGPTSSSSMYSSLPTSGSFPSLSPHGSPFTIPSQEASSASSPTTFFSPMTPATATTVGSGSGPTSASALTSGMNNEGYPWASRSNRASKSAVDIRTSARSQVHQKGYARPPTSYAQSNIILAPPPVRARAPPNQTQLQSQSQNHSAKRRRSEPEPELMKVKDVGLGVIGIPEHSQGPMEFLAPASNYDNKVSTPTRERPGIRRTASDSATTTLDFSTHKIRHPSRSPTPPLLESLKTEYVALDEEMEGPDGQSDQYNYQSQSHSQSDQVGLLASVALNALIESRHDGVRRALADLKFSSDTLRGLQPELAAFFGRYTLEKEMGAVSLEDRPSTSYDMPMYTSAYMSNSATPLRDPLPLSATSTCPSSPTLSRFEMPNSISSSQLALPPTSSHGILTTQSARTSISKATPKNPSKGPSRARSLSSASMRARGLKMSSASTINAPHGGPIKSPAMSLYQETLVSPMNSTTYQFPHTPHVQAMPDSDGASPMLSSVQTPTTGQGGFPHHEIMAIGAGAMGVRHSQEHGHGQAGLGQDDGTGHHRSATDPMGGKVYTRHAGHGDSWGLKGDDRYQTYHRSGHTQSQSISHTHGHGQLSSPLDVPRYPGSGSGSGLASISYGNSYDNGGTHVGGEVSSFPAPPPHLPPTFAFAPPPLPQQQQQQQSIMMHGQDQSQEVLNSTSPVNTFQPVFATPSAQRHHRSHHPSGSISTPYTPTPMSHSTSGYGRTSQMGQGQGQGQAIYQPSITPIAELGTPTRPTPSPSNPHRESMMLGQSQDRRQGIPRQGDMEDMMLSPQPTLAPVVNNGWFGQAAVPGPFEMDPFNSTNHQN